MLVAAARAERRLAAILAADIVGYSRLIEQDEATTLAAIRDLRREVIDPLLAEHHGRVVKLMGDGVIAEFGSVVDAVACAVAIQKSTAACQAETPPEQRIVFRMGVNLGDVVVEGEDLLGDGVNVAARLEQLCEPGSVLVSGTAYDHLQGRLGLPLEFIGEQRVKNIERPVRTYRVGVDGTAMRPAARSWRRLPGRLVAAALALLVVAATAAGGWWWYQTRDGDSTTAQALPEPPALAVLPFQNLSGDERLDRFANGLAADIIADLSVNRLLTVIAPGTSLASAEGPRDARQIGRELGVGYVLDGTLQGDSRQLRATAQVVDAATGAQLWSERFDRPLEDLSAVQDELTQRIASALSGGINGVVFDATLDAARRRPVESLRPRELLLLAMEQRERWTKDGNAKALELVQRAIALAPRDSAGYVQLAYIYQQQIDLGWAASDDEAMARWLEAARTAVDPDPAYPWARLTLGIGYQYTGDQRGVAELGRAAELAPGIADLLAEVAANLPWLGEPERAVELIERAVRLKPNADYRWIQGNVYFFARRFADAAAVVERMNSPDRWAMRTAVLSYAQLGQTDDLERWRERLGESWPDYSAELNLATGDFGSGATAERSLFLDSVARAGLPLCATPEQLAQNPDIKRLPECAKVQARN
jgi:class 3 adenylate cyclase/TolB-like protein